MNRSLFLLLCLVSPAWCGGTLAAPATPEQLQTLLVQYPEADANRNGTLTLDEARAYRRAHAAR